MIKLYDCDVIVTVDDINYEFEHVDSVVTEDPLFNRLTRGANRGNKVGLAYLEGVKDPVTITTSIIGFTPELHGVLTEAAELQKRVKLSAISRVDGSSATAKNAILAQRPRQLTLDDSPESLNSELIFHSFDVEEIHKS